MDKNLLINDLSELLEIKKEQLIEQFNLLKHTLWDSLAIVSTVASIDEHYNKIVHGCQLEKCEFLSDVFTLIQHAEGV